MSASHDDMHQKPAKSGESGSCCGGHEPQAADRDDPQAGAGKVPARERPSAKEPESRRAPRGGCGCGH